MIEYKLLNILMVLFSTQIVSTYLNSFRKGQRMCGITGQISWCAYIFFQFWVMESTASQPLLVLLMNIALVFFIGKFYYLINPKTALFLSGVFYSSWMLVEVVVNNLLLFTGIKDSSYFFVMGSAISKIAMYIAMHVMKRYKKSHLHIDMPFRYWIRLALIPIATFYIIHNTYCITYPKNNMLFTITTMLMLLINYVTFDVYDRLGNSAAAEKRNLAYKQQIALCNQQAEEREMAYQNTRRLRHDLNGYLIDIKTTIQSGKFEEAEQKIDTMLEQNQVYKNEVSHSGNLVIDSLINYKYSLAKKEKIDMKCHAFAPEQLSFDGADLCIILGNLIDNAIEAVSRLSEEQRHIEVSVSQMKGVLSISVKNPYEGKLRKNANGQILTNKNDSINHGIGLLSVQRSVEKYDGELLIDDKNGLFKVSILLYPPENLHDNS